MADAERLKAALLERFGEEVAVPADVGGLDRLAAMAARGTCRDFADRPVDPDLLRLLIACALAAPSKSDLQQRDIVVVRDRELRLRIARLLPRMPWVGAAPAFMVVCLNANRLPRLAELRRKPFPNNHLDLFFNAAGDAAIALAALLQAAEAVGLGGCPISEIRNHAALVCDWLGLPERVVPFAGLCMGWPARPAPISPRLPLALTVHEDRHGGEPLAEGIDAYDGRREALRPYPTRRAPDRWGEAEPYGWSEDKARQYAEPQRADFGTVVRGKGFCLD